MAKGLRLLVYDGTRAPGLLDETWALGAHFARKFGWFHHKYGGTNWKDTLRWLAEVGPGQKIREIHYWGHGSPGKVWMGDKAINYAVFISKLHIWHNLMSYVAERCDEKTLIWFRTCGTFAGPLGHQFATCMRDLFQCRIAAHTYIIHALQSGTHSVRPNKDPSWSKKEGLVDQSGKNPYEMKSSGLWEPNTILFSQGRIGRKW